MRNLKLLTILAREKAKGPASDFASYLELLPSKVNLEESDVYYAGEDLLKDFKVLPVINFWRRIQAEHYKELESCFEALKMQRPMETAGVLWKDVEVLLRTHRSRYFAISQPSLEFLGPGADWVNTGTRTEQNVKAVLTISGKHQEMTLQFVASRDLKPGEELILSYFTGLDNEDILFRWNMYLEGNDISLDAGDTATVCSAGGQDLRSASLEMLDLNVERQVPRCRDSGKRQGVLRCSLARLAYELCVGSWFPERSAVNPAPQTPASRSKGDRVAGYLIMYSMILRSRGDRAGAKEALNDLFSRAEKGLAAASLVDAHLQMAEWLLEEEELQESEKHILAAMRVREEAKAYFNHGLIFLARGDSLNALQSFRRGRQLSEPGSAVEAECARMLQKSLGALGLTGPSATRTERAHPLYYNQSNVLSTLLVG